jgi:hypothetical protein
VAVEGVRSQQVIQQFGQCLSYALVDQSLWAEPVESALSPSGCAKLGSLSSGRSGI